MAKPIALPVAEDVTFDTEAQFSLGAARVALVKYVTRIGDNEDLYEALEETLKVVAKFGKARFAAETAEAAAVAKAIADAEAAAEAKAAAVRLAEAEAAVVASEAQTSRLTAALELLKG